MDTHVIERQFAKIGARARLAEAGGRAARGGVSIDIGCDKQGEYFEIRVAPQAEPEIFAVDVQPGIRHLLLHVEQTDGKHKFLCGHDERHWFVAAVPERASASTVQKAFEALKPAEVTQRENRLRVKKSKRNRRRNEAFIRQGEWFFVPTPDLQVSELIVLRNEPLRRGNGKPHLCDELVRYGGELVYTSPQHRGGLTEREFRSLLSRKPEIRFQRWVSQRRNPSVAVRGKVRHADHKTIVLDGWHRVLMNTETQSQAMRHVVFID